MGKRTLAGAALPLKRQTIDRSRVVTRPGLFAVPILTYKFHSVIRGSFANGRQNDRAFYRMFDARDACRTHVCSCAVRRHTAEAELFRLVGAPGSGGRREDRAPSHARGAKA